MAIKEITPRKFDEEPEEMPFLDHLEVFRWHLIRSVIAVFVCMLVGFASMNWVFQEVILGPASSDFWTYRMMCKISDLLCVSEVNFTLQSRQLSGQFSMHILASLVFGIIVAFPYVFWELWRFVRPGLYQKEAKAANSTIFFVTVLFVIGILFGYYVISPLSIQFLANYKLDDSIMNQFDITSYVSTLCMIVLGGGMIFQLPVIVHFLTSIGMLTPEFMKKYRKHAIVLIFVIAAILTPSPDVLSQLLVAAPMYLLFELSIFISRSAFKKYQSKEIISNVN
ncbi:twin-arginine translocase subunit TatC [Cytophagaceae bacterium ABcell3]|nr:twin-arginine translocase subunit TatC [Cytophagaceae bacterium ABcell3]